ncbi:hypothetical protein H2200_008027 [Cladophialophora chaetospira]|uniref:C2H2-type domain-containing protein n=1 Tax=Cladophialophora chaetospira TaxID=386627 RepID=A0AA39CH56_9EURO|nr:hypothetical protein H2200_008027 [Cladophialophora chaetospira]
MDQHVRADHQRVRPHWCTLCTKAYGKKSTLNQHVRTAHEDEEERPFPCQYCPKTFTDCANLGRHEATCGNGPQLEAKVHRFTCGICDATSSRPDNFKRHLKDIHQFSKADAAAEARRLDQCPRGSPVRSSTQAPTPPSAASASPVTAVTQPPLGQAVSHAVASVVSVPAAPQQLFVQTVPAAHQMQQYVQTLPAAAQVQLSPLAAAASAFPAPVQPQAYGQPVHQYAGFTSSAALQQRPPPLMPVQSFVSGLGQPAVVPQEQFGRVALPVNGDPFMGYLPAATDPAWTGDGQGQPDMGPLDSFELAAALESFNRGEFATDLELPGMPLGTFPGSQQMGDPAETWFNSLDNGWNSMPVY